MDAATCHLWYVYTTALTLHKQLAVRTCRLQEDLRVSVVYTYCSKPFLTSLPKLPHPPPLSRPRYDIFSWAVHRSALWSPQNISYRDFCGGGGGGNFGSHYRVPQGNRFFLASCREEAKAWFSLPLAGPYRLVGATLPKRLAASRDYSYRDLTTSSPTILSKRNT